jgi:hypothetical protein
VRNSELLHTVLFLNRFLRDHGKNELSGIQGTFETQTEWLGVADRAEIGFPVQLTPTQPCGRWDDETANLPRHTGLTGPQPLLRCQVSTAVSGGNSIVLEAFVELTCASV